MPQRHASAPARASRRGLLALLGLLLVLSGLATMGPAYARTDRQAPIGSDRFWIGHAYRGDFPDPSVVKVGDTWFAYSTTIAALHLPVISSPDLVHWRAVGEGMVKPARWAATRKIGKRRFATTWAPTVAKFGSRWRHAYATPVRGTTPRKMCISMSSSTGPARGFVDRSRRPLICPRDRGAIDPQFFTDADGSRYLLWKTEQKPDKPSQLMVTPLSPNGARLAGPAQALLTTQDRWERPLIENPSMILFAGRYYLFYSGASYADDSYATGYAICETVTGPCSRPVSEPLLATGGAVSGPGGASAFLDDAGQLRLAYAAWDLGNTGYPTSTKCLRTAQGCPQRKLHVATLAADPDTGLLSVAERG